MTARSVMEFDRKSIENASRETLLVELKGIASQEFPGDLARQTAEKIIMQLRLRDGKITQEAYEAFWSERRF